MTTHTSFAIAAAVVVAASFSYVDVQEKTYNDASKISFNNKLEQQQQQVYPSSSNKSGRRIRIARPQDIIYI